jgi:hypothetical protein
MRNAYKILIRKPGRETTLKYVRGERIILSVKSSSTTYLWRCGEERIYSSYSFTTSVLDGGERSV